MSGSNGKSADANQVTWVAENLESIRRIVGNLPTVLLVLCVSKDDGANDLVANSCAQAADSSCCKGGTLAINCIRN